MVKRSNPQTAEMQAGQSRWTFETQTSSTPPGMETIERPPSLTWPRPAQPWDCVPRATWPRQAADPLSEADLSWIWAGQRYPAESLSIVDGRALRVINPGRPGRGPGPDYRDAILEVGGEHLVGDVELHVRASAFRSHGHAWDPAYNRVALHVVYLADDGPDTLLNSGRRVPVAAFAPWLEGRIEEMNAWLRTRARWHTPCHDAVPRLGEEAVREALREAGRWRLAMKAGAGVTGAEELGLQADLWRNLLLLSGAGGDRDGWRRLADAFPYALARRLVRGTAAAEAETRLTAALLAVAGLTDAPEGLVLPPRIVPRLRAVGRPSNHPARRLAGAGVLLVRAEADLAGYLSQAVMSAEDSRQLAAALQATSSRGDALIGLDRALELAINLALPYALGRPALREHALELAETLPAGPAYGKTAFLESNLASEMGKRLVKNGLEQQGLLAYLDAWCSRGGCGRCPLSPQ